MSETLGLRNVNMMSKEMYGNIADEDIKRDELYAISGSGFGFPSDRYDDLELGANGTEYTAPANGYFYFSKKASASAQWFQLSNKGKYSINLWSSGSGQSISDAIECLKGDVITVSYTLGGTTDAFRFIYAEGE